MLSLLRKSRSYFLGLVVVVFIAPVPADAQDAPASVSADSQPASGSNVRPSVEGAELAAIEAERAKLFAQMLADPSNLDVAFRYAGLSARAGDVEAAIATLERMLIFAPGLPRLQLELGVLYYRLGAYDTAQLYFDSAIASPNVPEVVLARVEPYVGAIEERTSEDQVSGVVTAGIRYQTNANAAPENRTIRVFFGGAFDRDIALDDDSLGDDDFNGFASTVFNYSRDLQNQGDRFEAQLLTYGAGYLEHDELNLALGELTAGPVFDLERFNIENAALGVYGIFSGVFLEEDFYLGGAGVGASFAKLLGPRTRFVSQHEYRHEEFLDSDRRPTASDRSGERFRSSQRVQHQVTERFGIFAAFETDRRFAERDYLSAWELGGTAGWALAMNSPIAALEELWTVGLSGGYAYRLYDEPDLIFSPDRQEDHEGIVIGTLAIPFDKDWSLLAQGGHRVIMSNYDIRDFDNTFGSLAVQRKF